MSKKQKNVSRWCYASYENNQLCMACSKPNHIDHIRNCTALDYTAGYEKKCPFFVPACVYRVNSKNGFEKCKKFTQRNYCEGAACLDYKPIKKGVSL